jgi:hypothetical protein
MCRGPAAPNRTPQRDGSATDAPLPSAVMKSLNGGSRRKVPCWQPRIHRGDAARQRGGVAWRCGNRASREMARPGSDLAGRGGQIARADLELAGTGPLRRPLPVLCRLCSRRLAQHDRRGGLDPATGPVFRKDIAKLRLARSLSGLRRAARGKPVSFILRIRGQQHAGNQVSNSARSAVTSRCASSPPARSATRQCIDAVRLSGLLGHHHARLP